MNSFSKYSKDFAGFGTVAGSNIDDRDNLLTIGKKTIEHSNSRFNSKPNIDVPFSSAKPATDYNLPKPKAKTADDYFVEWQKNPNPQTMGTILKQLDPVISSGLMTYVGSSDDLTRSKAKKITIDAIKSYDPNKASSLKSWVMLNLQGLKRETMQASPIKTPEKARLDFNYLNRITDEFVEEHGRQPSDIELADESGLSVKRINYVRDLQRSSVTEGQVSEAEAADEATGYSPSTNFTDWEQIWLDYVYHDLDPISKQIMDMRMGRNKYKDKPLSVQQIAKELKMTPSAVSQRSNKIADQIAKVFEMEGLV